MHYLSTNINQQNIDIMSLCMKSLHNLYEAMTNSYWKMINVYRNDAQKQLFGKIERLSFSTVAILINENSINSIWVLIYLQQTLICANTFASFVA